MVSGLVCLTEELPVFTLGDTVDMLAVDCVGPFPTGCCLALDEAAFSSSMS